LTAVEIVPDITPSYLRERAAKCREESNAARQRAHALLTEAIRLEREADALTAVEALPQPPARIAFEPSERALLAGDIAVHLNHHRTRQGKTSSELAEFFEVSPSRVRSALELAIECGFVRRTGLKRGTRYWATDKAPETPDPFGQRWHERVRDEAIKLGTFTLAELADRLPELSEATLRRWLKQLVDDGAFECERVGVTNVYAYLEPTPEPLRKVEGTERTEERSRHGRGAVAGTGNNRRAARREVRDIIRTVERQGATVREGKHSYVIEHNGEVIDAVAKTASDTHSNRNLAAKLKRGGLDV
jgi:DNA-binding HxlR family transcriptional regulator